MSERFVDVGSVDNFIAEQENKATLQKTQRDVKLLQTFLGTRNELRKIEEISYKMRAYDFYSLVVSYQKTHY